MNNANVWTLKNPNGARIQNGTQHDRVNTPSNHPQSHSKHRSHIINILLGIICITAFALRIYKLPERLWWGGDMARDLLVATHIRAFHEFPMLGHTATGFLPNSVFYYPPYWYYFLSLFTFVSSNPVIIAGALVVLQTMLIVAMYKLGNLPGGKIPGLCVAILYAFSAKLIELNSNIWPVVVMPLFFFSGYYLMLKNSSITAKYCGYALMIFATTIHYSAIGLLIGAILYDTMIAIQKRQYIHILYAGIFTTIIIGVLYAPLFIARGHEEVMKYFIYQNRFLIPGNMLDHVRTVIIDIWLNLFDVNQHAVATFASVVLLMHAAGAILLKRKQYLTSIAPHVFTTLIFIVFLAIKPVPTWNYTAAYPLFILIAGVTFGHIIQNGGVYRSNYIGAISVVLFAALLFNNGTIFTHCCSNDIRRTKDIIAAISSHAERSGIASYDVLADERLSGLRHERFTYWYFIEQSNGKFLQVRDVNENLELIDKRPKPQYLICVNKHDNFTPECVTDFLNAYPGYTQEYTVASGLPMVDILMFAPPKI